METDILIKIMPYVTKSKADLFIDPLNKSMAEFQINTPLRQAAFLAQVGHESGQFRYLKELASGSAYEGRKDLGNIISGDGARFKGRGLIQITGRSNYLSCGIALGLDLINNPELLEEPINACRSAAWWWKKHDLNELADVNDYLGISIRINGKNKDGLPNGWEDRVALYKKAREVLNVYSE